MERMSDSLTLVKYLYNEHTSRYLHILPYLYGEVIDCACGIGYASELLKTNSHIDSYVGVDIDRDSIEFAIKNYAVEEKNISFSYGSIMNLEYEDSCFDCFISMETLEHLIEPDNALLEIKRVLKPSGIFAGSVPIDAYEDRCSLVYGANPYHVQKFSLERLTALLKHNFSHVYLMKSTREVVTRFESVLHKPNDCDVIENAVISHNSGVDFNDGSYVFICADRPLDVSNDTFYYTGNSLIDYDEEVVLPLRAALANAEKMALDRWAIIEEYENKLNGLHKEVIIPLQDSVKYAEKLAVDRWDLILKYEAIIENLKNQISELELKKREE